MNLQARVREKGTDLDQAIVFFETRYRPDTKTISILNAKEEFLRTRHGISEATRDNYETGLSLLLKKDPKQRKSEAKNEVVVIEIEWIRGWFQPRACRFPSPVERTQHLHNCCHQL